MTKSIWVAIGISSLLAGFLLFTAGFFFGKSKAPVQSIYIRDTVFIVDTVYLRDTFHLKAKGCEELEFAGSLAYGVQRGYTYSSSLLTKINPRYSFFLYPFAGLTYSISRHRLTPYIGAEFKLRKNISGHIIYMMDKTVGVGIIWRW